MKKLGTGDHAVVCLHGWYGHADGWGYLPEVVDTDSFTWYFPEMRGFGLRRGAEGPFTMWQYAKDALAEADAEGLGRFSVLGHSMGGKAAAALVAQAPDRVRALVGLSAVWPGPVPMDESSEDLFFGAPGNPENRFGIIDFTTGGVAGRSWVAGMVADSLATSDEAAFAGAVESWVRDDYREQFGRLPVPALFLTGSLDPALSAEGARQTWLTLADDAEVRELPCGHYATHEAPVALAAAIEGFLGSEAVQ
ncbi:MAG TPA: alpha/beta hydrolase [Propionibacterium sp.]|nr:alpha/beta hydrolase [Propionibacterium sp.]